MFIHDIILTPDKSKGTDSKRLHCSYCNLQQVGGRSKEDLREKNLHQRSFYESGIMVTIGRPCTGTWLLYWHISLTCLVILCA